jgi:hypothetical protein
MDSQTQQHYQKRIEKEFEKPSTVYALHTIITVIDYLQKKHFTLEDFDKVIEDFKRGNK